MLKISIPAPCPQKWEDMKPGSQGRFCTSCEKNIVDFTKMEDADFVHYFQHVKTIPCGRFTQRQLTLEIPPKPFLLLPFKKWGKYVAASILATTALAGKTWAQQSSAQAPSLDTHKTAGYKAAVTDQQLTTIKGHVVDEQGNVVAGAKVSIASLHLHTSTDMDGNFILTFPAAWQENNAHLMLHILYIGQDELEVPVNGSLEESFVLRMDRGVLGGAEFYRPGKWQRIKYWIKNNLL